MFSECHGTGTALGDPLEVGALRTVMCKPKRKTPLLLGTVKTNVAHTESASGVVGLIKSVLHMNRSCAPANLHLRQLNEHIDRDASSTEPSELEFPIEMCSLAARTGRNIFGTVSAFGLGGCNATAIFKSNPNTTTGRVDSRAASLHVETWAYSECNFAGSKA